PVVNVEVDTTGGPGHGQTIADLRGMYRDFPEQEGAHCSVLLDVDPKIADEVVDLIAAHR
ncbi:MAG: nucleoside hydrolase, partial [Actinobacteria bacterium]|nr:nucleoside hydrolase [Actinomycetota bacterium]